MKPETSSTLRSTLAGAILLLSLLTGCRGSSQTNHPLEGPVMNTSDWETVYAGRASLRLPEGTAVDFAHTEVNQVELRHIQPEAHGFEQSWLERVDAVKRGKGQPNTKTTLVRDYSGQHTILFDSTGGAGQQRTLEHWQAYGSAIFSGQTVMNLDEVPLGEKAIQDVFAAITPHAVPQPGDFALDGANVHVPLDGRERISLSWIVPVPGKAPGSTVPLRFTLLSDVAAELGKPEVLSSLGNLRQAAQAHGIRVTVLRAGPHALAGLNGEESAVTLLDSAKPQTFQFNARWAFVGRPNDALAPGTELSADTDSIQNVDPAILLSYWQTISSSLRFQ
jgi:hypothetical protein